MIQADTVRRNKMLVTLRDLRVKTNLHSQIEECVKMMCLLVSDWLALAAT